MKPNLGLVAWNFFEMPTPTFCPTCPFLPDILGRVVRHFPFQEVETPWSQLNLENTHQTSILSFLSDETCSKNSTDEIWMKAIAPRSQTIQVGFYFKQVTTKRRWTQGNCVSHCHYLNQSVITEHSRKNTNSSCFYRKVLYNFQLK